MSGLAQIAWRPIVRRHAPLGVRGGVDLVDLARVVVSSEQSLFPVDNLFDDQRGPGGSCWVADDAGEHTLTLALASPLRVGTIVVESEKHGGIYTQAITLAVSDGVDGPLRELGTRSFTFKPYGPTFQTESWSVTLSPITQIHLRVTPVGRTDRASLTSVVIH